MDKSYFEEVIYQGKSNRLKQSFIKNNFIEFYNFIECNYVGEKFLEKVYKYYKGQTFCYCGNSTKFIDFKRGYLTFCSSKCSSNDKTVREKYKNTCFSKYNTDNVSKSNDIKKKKEKTFIERYGKKNYLLTDNVKDIIRNKYGVNNVFQNEEIKDKIYNTNIEKYGHKFPILNKQIKDKSIETTITKYEVSHYSKSEEFKQRIKSYNYDKYIESFSIDGYSIVDKNNITNKLFHNKCGREFEIQTQLIRKRVNESKEICLHCNPFIPSYKEKEILEFIKLYEQNIITNYRNKYEIDIFLPNLKIGFEFNGLYWHSELFKNSSYHLDKKNHFKENGINLIQIWEDDWIYKKNIVESIIMNKIGKTPNKIYARNCAIREISVSEERGFLEKNHLQSWCVSKYRLALIYNDEIVSLITFGNERINLGSKDKNKLNYELLRFCNILKTNVVGGFSKLLKYFIKKYEPERIITYANKCISNGDLYLKNGFIFKKETKPNYYYLFKGKRLNRFRFIKSNIKENTENLTEKEFMFKNGYLRIYDCGSSKYEIIFN